MNSLLNPSQSSGSDIDVDRMMKEIRAEIAARLPTRREDDRVGSAGDARSLRQPGDSNVQSIHLGRIGEVESPLPKKAGYVVRDFLVRHDEDFVRTTYRAVLGREPDAEGASRYLSKLRSGELSKTELLGRIRFSPEGRIGRVPIKGLLIPFGMETMRRVPVLGRILGIAQYIWQLPDIVRSHEQLESAVFADRTETRRGINAIVSDVETVLTQTQQANAEYASLGDTRYEGARQAVLADIGRLSRQLQSLATALAAKADQLAVENAIHALRTALAEVKATEAEFRAKTANASLEIDSLRNASQELAQRFGELPSGVDFAAAIAMAEGAANEARRIDAALEEIRARLRAQGTGLDAVEQEQNRVSDSFYLAFEDKFRGAREDIKQRVGIYLPLVQEAGGGSDEAPILDIGCGRGEWLELLMERNLACEGVEINRVAVADCRGRGLAVIEADGIEHLRSLAPGSLGAVTAIHVIEHIPFHRLVALFDEAWRVVRPGGIVIFETPNPENLVVGACNFYYDPTHIKPLPPEPLRFILEARGFGRVDIMRLHPRMDVPDFGEGMSALSRVISEQLFGPQDYALIGYKN